MKNSIISFVLIVSLLAGCTSIQRGGIIGGLIGGGIGAGAGVATGGLGVIIGGGAGAAGGALLGMVAGELYETHRIRMKEEYENYNPKTGAAVINTKTLADYEKHIATMEARNKNLIAQKERLIASSYTIANAIGADGRYVRVETSDEGGIQVIMVSEVLFELGSSKIKVAIYPVLDEIALAINEKYPDYYIAIEGHSDINESLSENYRSDWELSAARALAVMHYFKDRKLIGANKMAVASYGSTRPVADSSTPDGQRTNRRVVINLMPSPSNATSTFVPQEELAF